MVTIETPLRGVNLGGWLILEKWMTPSLFAGTDAADEYTFMKTPGAEAKLRQHHATFITESDFAWLAANGINAIRIPVGYWIFDGDDPFISSIDRLDWAVKMAEKYDIRVLIDLHGAKGSQNGQDHSGKKGESSWRHERAYRETTVDTLERLAKRYVDASSVWGIELLNEPKPAVFQFALRKFYRQAYQRLVATARPGTYIVFSDAFRPRMLSGALRAEVSHPVAMDIHWYQFGETFQRLRTLPGYFRRLLHRPRLIRRLQQEQPVIIGEWSGVLTERVMKKLSAAERDQKLRQHLRVQLKMYQQADGWFYWSYKTESPGIWNFRSLVEAGKLHLD